MSKPKALVVGDHFIPSEAYVAELGGDLDMSVVELGGSKRQQHADQQRMERHGPSAIDVSPELVAAMRTNDFVMVHFAPVPETAFGESSRLKAVFTARTGVENVALDAATAAGVPVFNVGGRNASGVAELALGLMISEARNIARADRSVKEGDWRKDFHPTPTEVGGSTVGLVGFGHVGRELARRLDGFDVELLVSDPYVDEADVAAFGGRVVDIEDVFKNSDFISLQARVTPETTEMVDHRLLSLMKPTAYLVNVGRSRLVNTQDLIDALAANRIAGAGLDVHDEVPLPPDSPLRRLDNVTTTTHFGGDTATTNARSAHLVAEAVRRFISTGTVAEAVNGTALTSV